MNTNNFNEEFQFINNCNFGMHWTWSNFYRHLFTCNSIVKNCKEGAEIIELGCGADSPTENYLKNNFGKTYRFRKYDAVSGANIIKHNIIKGFPNMPGKSIDAVIFTEVIEHIPKHAEFVLEEIRRILKPKGIMVFSTPTPNPRVEKVTWEESHEIEFTYDEIFVMINKFFKINNQMTWSQTKLDYCNSLKKNKNIQQLHSSLHGRLPEGFIRALCSLFVDELDSRRIIMECSPRKEGV